MTESAEFRNNRTGTATSFLWFFLGCWCLAALFATIFAWSNAQSEGWAAQSWWLAFPAIAVLIFWRARRRAAIERRRGGATLTLRPAVPLVGDTFDAEVRFDQAQPAGRAYQLRLTRTRVDEEVTAAGREPKSYRVIVEQTVSVRDDAGTSVLACSIAIPADAVPRLAPLRGTIMRYTWQIELEPVPREPPFEFEIELGPASAMQFTHPLDRA